MVEDQIARLAALVGTARTPLEPGEWRSIDQREEDLFAALIGDYDPMHNESDWAKGVGLRAPVILGVHMLGLLPALLREHGFPAQCDDVVRWFPLRLGKVRIPTSLPVGQRFRAHAVVLGAEQHDDRIFTVSTAHHVEIESVNSPFMVIENLVSRYTFSP